MSTYRRVLALAMDGAAPALIRRWAGEGVMPNLARLIASGRSGTVRGLEHFYVGSTWPSLYTGGSPADHGHHSLIQLRPGTYDYHFMADGDLVAQPAFWEHLSRAGRRVAILDVPLSKLTPGLNGIQTVEWGSHDAVYGFRCSSAELEREILKKFGRHPLGPSCDAAHRSPEDYERFIGRLLAGIGRKTDLTLALLGKERWDFFMQVFTESHCAGHQCWHLHDPAHPAHDPAYTAVTGDPLKRVYAAIDAGIGRVLDAADDDVAVVVFSAHGMDYWYGAQLLLHEILFKLGVANPPQAVEPPRRAVDAIIDPIVDPIVDLAAWGWRRLPAQARKRLAPLRARVLRAGEARAGPPRLGVDPSRSRCFTVYNGLIEGGIRLNLAGREPAGLVAPGREADELCAELRRELLAVVDERTGHALIRDVVRTGEVMTGPHLGDLPDLLVLWSDEVPTGSVAVGAGRAATIRARSPRIGVVEGTNEYGRTGEHRRDGFCVLAGPGIEPGALREDFALLDFAPMFMSMLGVEPTHGA